MLPSIRYPQYCLEPTGRNGVRSGHGRRQGGGQEHGGLATRLAKAGLTAGSGVVWGDEMRVGLRGRVCKVWAPRGVAVPQEVQIG